MSVQIWHIYVHATGSSACSSRAMSLALRLEYREMYTATQEELYLLMSTTLLLKSVIPRSIRSVSSGDS
jgi:hypothetical protein